MEHGPQQDHQEHATSGLKAAGFMMYVLITRFKLFYYHVVGETNVLCKYVTICPASFHLKSLKFVRKGMSIFALFSTTHTSSYNLFMLPSIVESNKNGTQFLFSGRLKELVSSLNVENFKPGFKTCWIVPLGSNEFSNNVEET